MEQLIYNILTYLIIGAALFLAGKKVYQKMKPQTDPSCSSGCGGCSSSVSCEIKDLVNKQ